VSELLHGIFLTILVSVRASAARDFPREYERKT
jgi:hypothetical protein